MATDAPKHMRKGLDAIRHLEEAVLGAPGLEPVVLRYGNFYGPSTIADEGDIVEMVRRPCFLMIGSGNGVWSFVHIDDAATATVLAIEGGSGIYNIVDDDPARWPSGCPDWRQRWAPARPFGYRAHRPPGGRCAV